MELIGLNIMTNNMKFKLLSHKYIKEFFRDILAWNGLLNTLAHFYAR
jgi:hypothetical protein